jgi:hypothetical protein
VSHRQQAPDPATLPYDRRLAQRLAADLLAARRELAACRAHAEQAESEHRGALAACQAAAAEAADHHAWALANERARHEAQLAELRATETWRIGAAVVALPRWVRRQLRSRGR